MTATASDFDVWDLDAFVRGEHHAWLRELRNDDPGIHWIDEGERGPGFWAVTRLEHLREVNRTPEVFSSNHRGTQINEPEEGGIDAVARDSLMLSMDPPKHTRYRKLVNRGFTPRMINMLDAYLENRSKMIIDLVCERGEAEFVIDIAAELPLQAIAEIVGVPMDDRDKIFEWTNRMIGSDDPDFAHSPEHVQEAFTELYMYSHNLQQARRAQPADDIVTRLLEADIDGEKLDETEFDMFFLLLCVAGNETTRNSLSWGMHGFMTNPDQWALLLDDLDGRMAGAVEEVVRWATPVMNFRRQAMQDYTLGGVQIREGDKVIMWHASANRDERAFDRPYEFDITRWPNDHIGFGGGGP
ncbi:MAG: cytochrome P450, partial [Acidimicrobiales bacterium]|nr:cytochrome P450 [Acidimicrobiales bacterium]